MTPQCHITSIPNFCVFSSGTLGLPLKEGSHQFQVPTAESSGSSSERVVRSFSQRVVRSRGSTQYASMVCGPGMNRFYRRYHSFHETLKCTGNIFISKNTDIRFHRSQPAGAESPQRESILHLRVGRENFVSYLSFARGVTVMRMRISYSSHNSTSLVTRCQVHKKA